MSKRIKSLAVAFLLLICLCSGVVSAVATQTANTEAIVVDYVEEASFEAALNRGESLVGKTVSFTAGEIHPDSAFGYNVWAGEHLNFVSAENPNVKPGDTVIAKVEKAENVLGSWIIYYNKLASSEGKVSTQEEIQTEKPKLEIVDNGWYIDSSAYSDVVYVDYCAMIYNPSTNLVASFPKVTVRIEDTNGNVLSMDTHVGMNIMPNDTITLVNMFSMQKSDLKNASKIYFDVSCSDFTSENLTESPKTMDFVVTNVSEKNGKSEHFITGKVTNNFGKDIETANVSLVLRKDGKIVYMENTFLDGLATGQTQAFEFQRYEAWPNHDTIEISVQEW